MALSDFYQLVLSQELFTEPLLNVFFYRKNGAGGTASELAGLFESTILPDIVGVQSANVSNVGIRVINLGSFTDFVENSVPGVGAVSANNAPKSVAMQFTLRVNTRQIRPGGKRFGGVPISWVDPDDTFTSAAATPMNNLRNALKETLTGGVSGVSYIPVVVGRVKYLPAGGTVERYRLPETDGELTANGYGDIVTVLTPSTVSHQVSRDD